LAFEVERLRFEALLEGLDDLGLTLKHLDAIDAWEHADAAQRPWNWPAHPTPLFPNPSIQETK
jgi:3-isopropylmalate/(R)-2-methylmalate dehydratase small subunit